MLIHTNEWREGRMQFSKVLVCLVTGIGLLAGAAQAEDLAKTGTYSGVFGWLGDGTVHELEENHIFWVGDFTGIFLNDAGKGFLHHAAVECPGADDMDFNKSTERAMGYCIATDADGDKAYLIWRCEGDTVTCPGTFEWTGGTGKYAGLTGNNTFTGISGPINQSGRQSGTAPWKGEWKLP